VLSTSRNLFAGLLSRQLLRQLNTIGTERGASPGF